MNIYYFCNFALFKRNFQNFPSTIMNLRYDDCYNTVKRQHCSIRCEMIIIDDVDDYDDRSDDDGVKHEKLSFLIEFFTNINMKTVEEKLINYGALR